jgi:hypothetical protein
MRSRRNGAVFLLAAVAPFLSGADGCVATEYELDLRPEGSVLHRRLTVRGYELKGGQRLPHAPPAESLARIAAFYPAPPVGSPASPSFMGSFDRQTPPDIDGAGRLLQLRSTLGTTWSYVERFGKVEDPATALARTRAAIEHVTAVLAGWLQHELGAHPARARVSEIEARVRAELESVLLYSWAARSSHVTRGASAMDESAELERMALFLVERGYVEAEELPRVVAALWHAYADDGARELMAFVHRWLSSELGCEPGDAAPAELDVLRDARASRDALTAYLRGRAKLDALASPVPQVAYRDPDGDEPEDPLDELASSLGTILDDGSGPLSGNRDTVTARLHLPTQPFATNGAWSARAGAVEWRELPLPGQTLLPTLAYAHWSAPDARYQRAHFGKVALRGEPLAKYVLWRASLDPGDGERWDAMIDSLQPGTDLPRRIEALGLGNGPDDSDLAAPARDLLRSALARPGPPRPRPASTGSRPPAPPQRATEKVDKAPN